MLIRLAAIWLDLNAIFLCLMFLRGLRRDA